jgi:hypothetical protein
MRGILRTLSILSAMFTPQFMRGTKVNAEGKEVDVKPRFVPGDKFYNQISFKRVKGKWRGKR